MELFITIGLVSAMFLLVGSILSPGRNVDPYQCLTDHPDTRQEAFIRDTFDRARKKGGLWRIDFYSHYVVIHTRSGKSLQFLNSDLGYDNIAMNRVVNSRGSQGYYEFAHRVKRAAERREAMCWLVKGKLTSSTAAGPDDTVTTASTAARENGLPVICVQVCTPAYDQATHHSQGASDQP